MSRAERELLFADSDRRSPARRARDVRSRHRVEADLRRHLGGPHGGPRGASGATARFTAGSSLATVTTVTPANATGRLIEEPDPKTGENYWTTNTPAKGLTSTRLEIPSPPGTTERRFLHVLAITDPAAAPGATVPIRSDAVDGAALDGEAYLFVRDAVQTRPAGVDYVAPEDAARHAIAGLAPGATYAVTVERAPGGCRVHLAQGPRGVTATAGGVALLNVTGCTPSDLRTATDPGHGISLQSPTMADPTTTRAHHCGASPGSFPSRLPTLTSVPLPADTPAVKLSFLFPCETWNVASAPINVAVPPTCSPTLPSAFWVPTPPRTVIASTEAAACSPFAPTRTKARESSFSDKPTWAEPDITSA